VAAEIHALAERIAPHGAINSLTQALLRLASPGVADLYQGAEFWDFSLVDPDNRRPVDFAAREQALDAGQSPEALLPHWRDGRVKQAILARGLAFRGRAPGLFTAGSYQPLRVEGPGAEHILAFVRVHEGRAAIVAGTRLSAALELRTNQPVVDPEQWRETRLVMPRPLVGRACTDIFTGTEALIGARSNVSVALTMLPVALLEVR
jgi:(1->4)-alpha-D-glucan 1-alpha-D-glucosylmutase